MKTIFAVLFLSVSFSLTAQNNKISTKATPNELNHKKALIIVDGIKYTRQDTLKILESINPDDIESVEVLKGEQAVVKYGNEGKDGVIIVTTKTPGKKEPLYIVDGIKVKDIAHLDPNDIESVNVLNGKDNTQSYGEEGKAGVVLITTKNAQKKNKN